MVEDLIDGEIASIVKASFDRLEVDLYPTTSDNAALNLLSIGELVDRLTITNIKLYKLKDFQVASQPMHDLASSATADVALVKERANLKATISQKICDIVARTIAGVSQPDTKEVKAYGEAKVDEAYIGHNRPKITYPEHSSANDPSVGRSAPRFKIDDKILIVRAKEGHYWCYSNIDRQIGKTGIVEDMYFDNENKVFMYKLNALSDVLDYVPEANLILRENASGRVPTRKPAKKAPSAYSTYDVDPKYT